MSSQGADREAETRDVDRFAKRAEEHERQQHNIEQSVIATNLRYAKESRGQFAHARALVMAEAITNLVESTTWRAS